MDIFIPCLPTVAAFFAVPFSTVQWVMTVYFMGAGLGQLVVGPLSDKYGRRPILLFSTLLFAISSLACAQTAVIWQLVLTRLLQGIGACGTTVVTMAIVRDVFDDETTPHAYSYLNGVISLAPTLGPMLGASLFMLTDSWRTGFYFMAAFSLTTLLINYLYVKESCIERHDIEFAKLFTKYQYVLSTKHFWVYAYSGIAGLSSLVMFFSVSSILLIERLKVAQNIFALYFGCTFAIYLLGNMISPRMQKQLGINATIFTGTLFLLFGGSVMLIFDQLFGLSIIGFLAPMMLVALGVGLLFGPCMAKAVQPFKQIAGLASASYGAIIYCSGGIISGLLLQFQIYNATPYAIGILLLNSLNLLIISNYFRYFKRKTTIPA